MSDLLKKALIGTAIALVIVPVIALGVFNVEFSVLIMLEIAVVALATVVVVMIVGSEEDHYPSEAKDSDAVNRWSDRLDNASES